MTEFNKAFGLFEKLKAKAIAESKTDEKLLAELLDEVFAELKLTKRSDFLDSLHTACMHYAYLPKHNKRSYPEVRVKPISMGVSGTDAMLLIELLTMRVESEKCAETEEYKTAAGKLFTSFVIPSQKISARLTRSFGKMNKILCQQGALAHFGSDEQKKRYEFVHESASVDAALDPTKASRDAERIIAEAGSTGEDMIVRAQKLADEIVENAKKEAEAIKARANSEVDAAVRNAKAKGEGIIAKAKTEREDLMAGARTEAGAELDKARKEAGDIVAFARKREKVMHDESRDSIMKQLASLLAQVTESNKCAIALQASVDENYPNKFAKDLFELYDLIADTYDAQSDEGVKSNLKSYMDLVEDILFKYGFEAVRSAEGAAFDGKVHEADDKKFDPKKAVIAKSLRCGFTRGGIVIRKEKTEVK